MLDQRLGVLRTVEHCGTVTAAAHALHLTPSAVSQQIRGLSQQLGVPLLVPEGRGVTLTPAAHIALRHAHRLHQHWEQALAEIQAHAEEHSGTLSLSGFPSAMAGLLTPTATQLRREHPQLAIQLHEAETPHCFELLLTDHTDLSVIVPNSESPTLDDPRFDQQTLLDDPLDLLLPSNHRLATSPTVALADAANEDWILNPPDATEQHTLTLTACTAAGFRPRVTHYASDWTAITTLVTAGLGVYLLPRLAQIPDTPAVTRLPLTGRPRPHRRILAATRSGSTNNPHIALARTALHDAAHTIAEALTHNERPETEH